MEWILFNYKSEGLFSKFNSEKIQKVLIIVKILMNPIQRKNASKNSSTFSGIQ